MRRGVACVWHGVGWRHVMWCGVGKGVGRSGGDLRWSGGCVGECPLLTRAQLNFLLPLQIYEGTSQIQRLIISRHMFAQGDLAP